jgi:iron complex outermembrane receptor protein
MKQNNKCPAWAVAAGAGICIAISVVAPLPAQAQEREDPNAALEKIEVTGSRIRRTDVEGPTPLIVLDREDFENQGYLTVTDVLDSLTQNTGGTLSQQFVFGFTPGATGVNLRGFGTGRTLVLLDGRRLPVYPLGLGGTTNFFDLSSIPTAIIERIEILTAGASAIYGSDAIGGVVNIITRKDFDGLTTRARYGDTEEGGYQTDQYEIVGGATTGKTSAYLTLQHLSNTELLATQRDYAASDVADPLGRGTYSAFGASIIEVFPVTGGLIVTPAPNCGQPDGPLGGLGIEPGTPGESNFLGAAWCGFNRTQFRQLFPENSRNTVSGRIDHQLDSGINLFTFARWTKSETNTQIEPFPYGGTWLFGGTPTNPTVPNNGGLFTGPSGGPAAFARRLVEFGPRTSNIEIESYGATIGAEGRLGAYDWEVGYTFNVQEVFRTRGGSIVVSALERRIEDGLDLFQPIPQDVVDAVSFSPFTDAESENDLIDAQITGFLPFDLPGGPIGVAAVAEFEQQEFFDRRDPITLSGDASDGGSAGAGARDRTAFGAEVSLPVLDSVEVNLAARWDDYDDQSETGSAISPRFTVTWRPLDNVLLRGSWGETFRAPDLQRLFGSTTTGFVNVLDTVICQQLGGSLGNALPPSVVDGDQNPYGAGFDPCIEPVQSVRSLTGANPSLEEEEGESINVGAVWNITDDLAISIDYYDQQLEQIINTPTGQFILNQCAAGVQSFCDSITRDPGGLLQGGQLSRVARNLSLQEISGVDLSASWAINAGEIGRFDLQSETTWVNEVVTQFDAASPKTEGVGIFSLPEWRTNFTANWNRGDLGATLRANFVGELGGINASAPLSGSEFVDSYLTFNGQLRYRFGQHTEIKFGVNNFTDERPPTDPTNPGWPWYINAGGYYSPFGREYYVEWVQHWR